MGFDSFGLDEALLQGTKDLGYKDPTPIQEQAIPAVLGGRDVIGLAQTGTGKTAAFLLPILHRLLRSPGPVTRCLVLAPTRELVQQIETVCVGLTYRTSLSMANVIGGADMSDQTRALKAGADIVIATPGRLLDHFYYGYPKTDKLEFLVLDEADRMLDMGFMPDIEKIVRRLPEKRQTLLFSATLPPPIEKLAKTILVDPVMIEIGNRRAPAESVSQELFECDHRRKPWLLVDLLKQRGMESVLIFTATKLGANRLWSQLVREGVKCAVIHGDREQAERFAALESFRHGETPVLVATDIAARGIDVSGISHVVNYDVPRSAEDFIHRIGRTGRAGETGHAITLCAPDEKYKLAIIERTLKIQLPRGAAPGRPDRGRETSGRNAPAREDSRSTQPRRDESRGEKPRREELRRDGTSPEDPVRERRPTEHGTRRSEVRRDRDERPRRSDRDRQPERKSRASERSLPDRRAERRDDRENHRSERDHDEPDRVARDRDDRRRDSVAPRDSGRENSRRRSGPSSSAERDGGSRRRADPVDRARDPDHERREPRRSRSDDSEQDRPRRIPPPSVSSDRHGRESGPGRSRRDHGDRDSDRGRSNASRDRDREPRSEFARDRSPGDRHDGSRPRGEHGRGDGGRAPGRGRGPADDARKEPDHGGRGRGSNSRSERSERTVGSDRQHRDHGRRRDSSSRGAGAGERGKPRGRGGRDQDREPRTDPRRGDPRVQPRSEGSKKLEDDPRFEWE